MSEKNDYYVYYLIDPRVDTPFYVGKGRGKRAYAHFARSSMFRGDRKIRSYKNNVIRKILSETGKKPVVKFFKKDLTEQEAFSIEVKQIKQLLKKGIKLTNMTDGGEGISGRVFKQPSSQRTAMKEWHANLPPEEKQKRKEYMSKR